MMKCFYPAPLSFSPVKLLINNLGACSFEVDIRQYFLKSWFTIMSEHDKPLIFITGQESIIKNLYIFSSENIICRIFQQV